MIKSARSHRFQLCATLMLVALFAAPGSRLFCQNTEASAPPFVGREWETALAPLDALPVQDHGFIRSAAGFATDLLKSISGRKSYDAQSALATILWLASDGNARREAPLLKVGRPEFGAIFGADRVSLAVYRDPARQKKFTDAIFADQKSLLKSAEDLESKARELEGLEDACAIIPRPQAWLSPAQLAPAGMKDASQDDPEILQAWESLKDALRKRDPAAARTAAESLAASADAAARVQNVALPPLSVEVFFVRSNPFGKSAALYLVAALCYGGALLFRRKWLSAAGFISLALALAAHGAGIGARWVFAGRAPLSNMYESFTFAIAGMALVALVFEAVQKTRILGFGAGLLGFVFMVIAAHVPIFNPELRPLMPALQSSWLTYHVATIMLSYSAFALSFFVSLCYLAKDALGGDTPRVGALRWLPSLNAMDVFNYKIIAVGFPLLTLGIVFGAVWAATAWGRPWGFDPKETWSAITWLIYAVYLHVRFLAGWKGRRAAIVALIGFTCVLFTYLGVNYLLPGLHSYA